MSDAFFTFELKLNFSDKILSKSNKKMTEQQQKVFNYEKGYEGLYYEEKLFQNILVEIFKYLTKIKRTFRIPKIFTGFSACSYKDPNRNTFEYQSMFLNVGVKAYSKKEGYLLLFLLRLIINNDSTNTIIKDLTFAGKDKMTINEIIDVWENNEKGAKIHSVHNTTIVERKNWDHTFNDNCFKVVKKDIRAMEIWNQRMLCHVLNHKQRSYYNGFNENRSSKKECIEMVDHYIKDFVLSEKLEFLQLLKQDINSFRIENKT